MSFTSGTFVIFLIVFLIAYYAVGRFVKRGQWVVLLAASLVFYAASGWRNLAFIGTTALVTWVAGRLFARFDGRMKEARKQAESRDEKKAIKAAFTRKKRWVLLGVLLITFGILAYLKYAETLVGYFNPDSGFTTGLLLPLGISFYTFQSASYVIDTYNGKSAPERNFARYLLFVSFFPQLIQGPINRFELLAEQLMATRSFNLQESRGAILQIGYGMLKKFAIADVLVRTVQISFANIDTGTPGSAIVFAILVYAVYQYADFSGGIDMALGVARLFGIQMSPNFRQPYFSTSLADFWRRWHITLGAWMRDYVFYPFALLSPVKAWGKHLTRVFGKHIGRTLPACVANILVFFLVGLWHGAQAHFIFWGIYNGLVIAGADLLGPVFTRMKTALHVNEESAGFHVFRIIRTFIVVNIGWYFDAIPKFGDVLLAFRNTLFNFRPDELLLQIEVYVKSYGLLFAGESYATAAVALVFVFVISVLAERGMNVEQRLLAAPVPARCVLYAAVLMIIMVSTIYGVDGGFMYANF